MEETLKKLREVHSSSLIIVLHKNNLIIYDEDAKIIEYNSTLIGKSNVLVFQYKHIEKIKKILRGKNINYVILDKDRNYKVFDYYFSDNNKYVFYLKRSKHFNKYRRIFVYFYNFIFGIPVNRYS